MADYGSLQSPAARYIKPISSIFFSCPKLFTGVSPDSQLLMSPTSILDSVPFSGFNNPFSSESATPKSTPEPDHPRRLWTNLESNSNKVGLSILESLEHDSRNQKQFKRDARVVLFGSQLKIQIPLQPDYSGDFGIKTRPCHHPNERQNSQKEEMIKKVKSRGVFSDCLSATDMELSEDYTCVISHGANPKTTHIYDNCIVESCCGVARNLAVSKTQTANHQPLPDDFLSHCYNCHKDLSIGEDIYMYKGEKAFCSCQCRYEKMQLDENNSDLD